MSYQNRGISVSEKISWLFSCLNTQTYDQVAPKIEYWSELALTQGFTTAEKLVEDISGLAWTTSRCPASVARFLREFRDSSRRSTQARSFVDEFCTRVFLWFAAASAEDLGMNGHSGRVANGGGYGFIEAASLVGYLIRGGLLNHDIVRLHLIKPLTAHCYSRPETSAETVRANAICRLFVVAGSALVQGHLEAEDVRVCFEILRTQSSKPDGIKGLSAAELEVQYGTHPNTSHRNLLTPSRGSGTSRAPCHVVAA